MPAKLKVGVVGVGRLGKMYARYFCGRIENATVVAIADVSRATLQAAGSELEVAKQFAHPEDLISDKGVDAVVIVSTTSTHKEIAVYAAQAGKPTFCEKPLSISLPDALDMQRAIDESGTFFQMG
ncbi:MAG TPA: Gfo/Idh/MocA family oxidoreductase, partial [Pyrinomonadaceae bacterium]|nr:Gfo/Idh/MocA family oxidoreductase [Pyrinomonadaceae bacterium]